MAQRSPCDLLTEALGFIHEEDWQGLNSFFATHDFVLDRYQAGLEEEGETGAPVMGAVATGQAVLPRSSWEEPDAAAGKQTSPVVRPPEQRDDAGSKPKKSKKRDPKVQEAASSENGSSTPGDAQDELSFTQLVAEEWEASKRAPKREGGRRTPAKPAPASSSGDGQMWYRAGLLALAMAVYYPAFGFQELIMDDSVAIARNPLVNGMMESYWEYFRRDFWGLEMFTGTWTHKSFRPITTCTYRLNFLLHGAPSVGYHITNVLMHGATSAVVGVATYVLIGMSPEMSLMSALLFAAHPVHTENVLYLVGRADILATSFCLLAVLLYASAYCPNSRLQLRRWARALGRTGLGSPLGEVLGWGSELKPSQKRPDLPSRAQEFEALAGKNVHSYLPLFASMAMIFVGGLCKETAFTIFAVFFAVDFLALIVDLTSRPLNIVSGVAQWWDNLTPSLRRAYMHSCIRLLQVAVGTVLMYKWRVGYTSGTELNMSQQDNPVPFEINPWSRKLSYAYLHGMYFRQLTLPLSLNYDYSMNAIPILHSITDMRLMLTLTAYLATAATIHLGLSMRLHASRSVILAAALILLPYFPASNILFPVGTVVGERLLYLPSVGYCMLLARFAAPSRDWRTPSKAAEETREDPPFRFPKLHFLFLTLGVYLVRTHTRVWVWETAETLFITDGDAQPRSAKTQYNVCITHMMHSRYDEAVLACARCAKADPLSGLPYWRIGQIEILRGHYNVAAQYLRAASDKFGASVMVRDEEIFHDLAVALFQDGQRADAVHYLNVALRLNPYFAKGWNNLGCATLQTDVRTALMFIEKAVQSEPESPHYWANMAAVAQYGGEHTTAVAAWQRAQLLAPELPPPQDCVWEFAPAT